ncbi:hypothetical protein IWZ03DRAFT_327853, partial [Phyllosticta citriasiana]
VKEKNGIPRTYLQLSHPHHLHPNSSPPRSRLCPSQRYVLDTITHCTASPAVPVAACPLRARLHPLFLDPRRRRDSIIVTSISPLCALLDLVSTASLTC